MIVIYVLIGTIALFLLPTWLIYAINILWQLDTQVTFGTYFAAMFIILLFASSAHHGDKF